MREPGWPQAPFRPRRAYRRHVRPHSSLAGLELGAGQVSAVPPDPGGQCRRVRADFENSIPIAPTHPTHPRNLMPSPWGGPPASLHPRIEPAPSPHPKMRHPPLQPSPPPDRRRNHRPHGRHLTPSTPTPYPLRRTSVAPVAAAAVIRHRRATVAATAVAVAAASSCCAVTP